ncbi:unnamed protein product [Euphydryas editha]|uniref:Endonuclease-reverse transcriptase n=1 Tax=Euphydryas editha TaxID=104508 RepID=A0AAU9TIB1_EUPED|nr:unnamed protein product [Euphydryas editha]
MKIEMENQTKEIISKMDDKLIHLITEIKNLKTENNDLREKIANFEKFKRKNNIIIHGFKETEKSSPELIETTIGKIKSDLNVSLDIRDIDLIHRVGRRTKEQTKGRPILVYFVNGWKKNEIMHNKKKLKDGHITEDYPKEVLLKRRELQKELVLERSKGNFAREGSKDVCASGDGICTLLAALPRLLRTGVPLPIISLIAVRPACLLGFLLASHGEFYVQPSNILLDE